MERKELIGEIKSTHSSRFAENWLITVTIALAILALAAGIDYSITEGKMIGIAAVWAGALIWILLFFIAHARVMGRLAKSENSIIESLEKGDNFGYSENRISPTPRCAVSSIALIAGIVLIVVIIKAIFMTYFVGGTPSELLAELTIIGFASLLAIISSLANLFPVKQQIYSIVVVARGEKPAAVNYTVRRR